MKRVQLMAPPAIRRERRFRITAIVSGANPGAAIEVQVTQTRGHEPLWSATMSVTSDHQGTATAVFELALRGRTRAVLVTAATDADGTHFQPDAESIRVT